MPIVIVLYIIGAFLPVIGFGRLLWRVQGRVRALDTVVAERGFSHSTWDDFDESYARDLRTPHQEERRDLIWDVIYVGSGLTVSAIAGIWSLFL